MLIQNYRSSGKKNNGACGCAWAQGVDTIYDSVDPDLQAPAEQVKKYQQDVVKSLKSVLSIPIWSDGKVVAVFNMDSKQNVTETQFHHPSVYLAAKLCARDLGAHLFPDGIKA
jgi:hypothetical protein